jgi:hypothetical protein
MYTGRAVRLRSFALVLALLVAATPVIGVLCEMECDQPRAGSSSPCHEGGDPDNGTTFRGVPHVCDHDHTGGSPALLTSATGRDSVGASVAAPPPTLLHGLVREAGMAAAAAMHGPPGLGSRSTSSQLTVLRI